MENYIMINGNKIELTEEQVEQLTNSKNKKLSSEEQYALHEKLNRMLWDFGEKNGGYFSKEECMDKTIKKYYIWDDGLSAGAFRLLVDGSASAANSSIGTTYFRSKKIAQDAIDIIVKPFLKKYKDFVW